jgi:hypothetical protein
LSGSFTSCGLFEPALLFPMSHSDHGSLVRAWRLSVIRGSRKAERWLDRLSSSPREIISLRLIRSWISPAESPCLDPPLTAARICSGVHSARAEDLVHARDS